MLVLRCSLRFASLLTALAAIALAPAAQADPAALSVKVAKHKGGPYQSVAPRVNLSPDQSKDLYLKVRSTASGRQSVTLTQDVFPAPIDYDLRWFEGAKAIGQAVRHGGFEFKLKAGELAKLRLHVTAHNSPDPACVDARFHVPGATQDAFGVFALNDDPNTICSG